MAAVNETITISRERRPCYVDGERALFHCWEQYSEIVAPSIAVGGHNGGEIRRVYGALFGSVVDRLAAYFGKRGTRMTIFYPVYKCRMCETVYRGMSVGKSAGHDGMRALLTQDSFISPAGDLMRRYDIHEHSDSSIGFADFQGLDIEKK